MFFSPNAKIVFAGVAGQEPGKGAHAVLGLVATGDRRRGELPAGKGGDAALAAGRLGPPSERIRGFRMEPGHGRDGHRGCTTPDWSHLSTRQWCNPATPPPFPGETGTSAFTRQARPGDGIICKKTMVAVSLGLCPKQGHHDREGHSSRERRGRSKTSKGTRREPPGLAAEGLLALPPNPDTATGGWQRCSSPKRFGGD